MKLRCCHPHSSLIYANNLERYLHLISQGEAEWILFVRTRKDFFDFPATAKINICGAYPGNDYVVYEGV